MYPRVSGALAQKKMHLPQKVRLLQINVFVRNESSRCVYSVLSDSSPLKDLKEVQLHPQLCLAGIQTGGGVVGKEIYSEDRVKSTSGGQVIEVLV